MIQATQKADSLPPELRKHWEDAMAEKFSLSQVEAIAFIQSHYMNTQAYVNGADKITVSYTERVNIHEGEMVPAGWTIEFEEDRGQVAYQQTGLAINPEQLQRMLNQRRIPKYMVRFTQTIIDDFRPTSIKKALKDIKV